VITQTSIETFLNDLASKAPTPGGGSAAAVIGAMGAALVSMVCNVSFGKKGCEAVEPELLAVRAESERLRGRLTEMVAEDVAAFDGLMAAYRRPKSNETEIAGRAAAIQSGLRGATLVPLACSRAAAEVIELARRAATAGYRGVISDAGVAALAAQAALRSAGLNVYVNAPLLADIDFARQSTQELDGLIETGGAASEAVYAIVRSRL
jgi:formiminotetrahydrofolate cyclodeaminase